ncbi:SRPBCC family protein [Flavobacterium sp.]|uniref:SRPBCC family protein n=1 Tax=Flavobacterium sp. TaxID=239 RepID=UPI002B4B59F2|nr:SRPBCC family protein [Flavobacterium sp.]HLF53319.1 SRPBCC family protein [Flavobacterium sp.]
MNVLKKILLFVLGVIAVLLIIGFFVKKDYAVERKIVINKPKTEVFEYIKHLKNQDNFSVWARKDPMTKKTYKGNDGEVGFVATWDSENEEVGKGEQEIAKIIEGERMDVKLRFKIPFEAEHDAYFLTESVSDNQTKVKWGFKGTMDYPMNLMLLFMDMDEMIGGDFEGGLKNLKEVLEK